MSRMYEIKFKYKDRYTRGNWSTQSCTVEADNKWEATEKCKEFYGLGVDTDDYEIVEIKENN